MDKIKCPCEIRADMRDEDCRNMKCKDCCPLTKPQTNADRLRAMNDEELAEWLVILTVYQESAFSPPAYRNLLTDIDDTKENAIKGTKEWLKQPAEERK